MGPSDRLRRLLGELAFGYDEGLVIRDWVIGKRPEPKPLVGKRRVALARRASEGEPPQVPR